LGQNTTTVRPRLQINTIFIALHRTYTMFGHFSTTWRCGLRRIEVVDKYEISIETTLNEKGQPFSPKSWPPRCFNCETLETTLAASRFANTGQAAITLCTLPRNPVSSASAAVSSRAALCFKCIRLVLSMCFKSIRLELVLYKIARLQKGS
jgi:hypothetical protein